MRPVCVHMGFFSLPHYLIKDKLINLIEKTFNREGSSYLAGNDKTQFFFYFDKLKNVMHGLVKMYLMRSPLCLTTFLFLFGTKNSKRV